jgi:hypothetical protein
MNRISDDRLGIFLREGRRGEARVAMPITAGEAAFRFGKARPELRILLNAGRPGDRLLRTDGGASR